MIKHLPLALAALLLVAAGPPGVTTPSVAPGAPIDSNTLLGRTAAARAGDVLNVLDRGVKGDGTTDDAPALRTICAAASGKTILFPANRTYLLGSTVSSGYPASDPVAVLCSQQTDFHVIAWGATFRVAPSIALSQVFLFDRSSHWTFDGGTIIGSRSGLTASQENVAFGLFSNVDFRLSPQRITGYGGTGGAFVGDYNVLGKIDTAFLDGVGIGFDMAFSKSMTISDIRATGADTNGLAGAGQVGQKFFSNIFDVPLAPTLTLSASAANGATSISYSVYPTSTTLAVGTAYPVYGTGILAGTTLTPTSAGSGSGSGTLSNATTTALTTSSTITAQLNFTGYAFQDTDGVSLVNSDFSNFASGIALSSGAHYRFSRNNSHDNPGLSSAKGLGYYIYYETSNLASSVGHPVTDVEIDGGQAVNNGTAVSGYGVLIDVSGITNSDVVDGILIHGMVLSNNTSTGIGAVGSALNNFTIGTNIYKGSAQTTPINSTALGLAKIIQQSAAGGVKLNAISSASSDLGFEFSRPGSYDWQYNASTGNGNFYLYNGLTGRFPFLVNANALTNALTVSPVGIQTAGVLDIGKLSSAPVAPGASNSRLFVTTGTNAGTCKLQVMAGTSSTPVTILDNIGAGC